MAVIYYPQNTNADTTCDFGTGTPYDLSKTAGTPTTHTVDTSGLTAWTVALTYNMVVTGDSPSGNTYDFSISLATVTNSEVRLRIYEVNSSCTLIDLTGLSATYSSSGTYTGTLTMAIGSWTTGTRLELQVEMQRASTHGTRQVIVDVQTANTYIQGNSFGGAGGGVKTGSVL